MADNYDADDIRAAINDLQRAVGGVSKEIQQFKHEMGLEVDALRSNTAAQDSDTESLRRHSRRLDAASDLGFWTRSKMVVGDLTGGLVTMGKQLQKNDDSFAVASSGIDALAKSASDMLARIPGATTGIEGLRVAASMLVTEMNDSLSAFQEISKVGGNTAEGIDTLRQIVPDTLLSLQKFGGVVSSNSTMLAQYGGTTAQGVEAFAEVQTRLANFDDGLRNLGYTVDEMAEGTAAYIALQAKSGKTQKMTADQLTQGTAMYLRELDELSRITGQSRKELMSHQQQIQSEARWRAHVNKLERTGRSDVLREERNVETAVAAKSPVIAQGIRDILGSGGALVTEESRKAFMVLPEIQTWLKDLSEGRITSEELLKKIGATAEKQKDNLEGLAGIVGEQSPYAPYAQIADLATVGQGIDEAARERANAEKKVSETTEDLTQAQKNTQQASAELHKTLSKGFPMMGEALYQSTDALKKLTTAVEDLTSNLGGGSMIKDAIESAGSGASSWIEKGGEMASGAARAAKEWITGESSGSVGTFTKGGGFKENAPELMRRVMKDFGLSKEQAAGLVGNLAHESAGLKAGVQEGKPTSGRGGLGWAQWTGVRRRNFEAYLQRTGQEATDPEANYGFLKEELRGSHKSSISALKKTNTVRDAMMAFEQQYEAAGVKHYGSRQRYADQAYNMGLAGPPGKSGQSVIDIARSHLGQNEANASGANGDLTQWLNQYSGTKFKDIAKDTEAWCARFVSATLEEAGHKSLKTASAKDYLKYGDEVKDKSKTQAGDVVLMRREGGSGYHVALSQGIDPKTGKLKIIGGNQGGKSQGGGGVTEKMVDLDSVAAIRRGNDIVAGPQTAKPDTGYDERKARAEELKRIGKSRASEEPVGSRYTQPELSEFVGPQSPTMESFGPQTTKITEELNRIPEGFGMEPPVGNAAVVESRRKLEPSTLAPATVTETLSNLGINPFGGIANAGIGSDAAATNRAYTPTTGITSVQNTGFGAARPGLPNLGQVLGNAAGSAIGRPMGDIARSGVGGVFGGNPGYGMAGIGQVLGGMAGSAIGGPMGGMLGSVISGVGRGLGGMTTPASPNLAAPEPAVASLEATAPQSQKAEQPTGGAASSDSGDMSALVSLMSEQISQLGSLNGLMRKQNSTAEQILKSQK
jgi:uncharacterized protein (TIGR02594 family)